MAARKDEKGRALRKGEYYRADGRYSYRYVDPFGKAHLIYCKNLVQLRQREEQLIRDQMDGIDAYVAGNATLNMVIERYLSTKSELRSTTYSNYCWIWEYYLRDTIGKRKIRDIKYSDILQFYTYLLQEKKLQINSLQSVNTLLHPAFQMAVRDDVIRKNPTDGAYKEIKKRFEGPKAQRHPLSVEEQSAFMNYIKDNPLYQKWNALFTVLLGTGCRIGEIVGLTWDDVDLDRRIIDINHSLTYYPRREDTYVCEFRASEPKTNAGYRIIPMMDSVHSVLVQEYDRRMREGFCEKDVDGITNFVFTNRFGGPHNPQSINRAIKRIVDAHNSEEQIKAKREHREPVMIPYFSCHILRHTFASRFCENETNIKVIQEIMGHADISTTMNIYAEVNGETKRQSIEKLAKNLNIF